MGFLDRLLGRDAGDRTGSGYGAPSDTPPRSAPRDEDEQALERYRYLVRTAPPERIEQAHEEAFAALTPDQRRQALEELSRAVPESERGTGDDPRSLARMATRAEMQRPGTVERAFGAGGLGGRGFGMGGMGVPLLGSFATAFAGTLAAQALFSELSEGDQSDGGGDQGGDAGADSGGDSGGSDLADTGGGDPGGGDFGGGDFGGDMGF